ncbi:MAG: ribonuclease H-like domain-containing protein [Spirochaetales bacterium]|nr:ribonuclease H-like domain-containing protein [Spirochaetales bacterium]
MGPTESLYEHLKAKKTKADADRRTARKESLPAPDLPGFERTGEFTYKRVFREPNPLASLGAEEPLLSARASAKDLLFFDAETTGLSGGAGNLAFLLGAGHLDGGDFVVEQHFLADFPGEPEFLRLIRPLLDPERVFVSYNGSAFDSHLLVSRFSLNRMELSFPRQYDILHPSRRLWKSKVAAALGSCSLKNVERLVLNVDRGEDIDGAEVPECYFRFLRSGDPSSLEPVFYHNRIDVLSLAGLLHRIESLLRDPASLFAASPGDEGLPPEFAALGAMLLALDPVRAEDFLRIAFDRGDSRCGLLLGSIHKRRREYEEAFRVWEAVFAAAPAWRSGIEIAMHLEHRRRDAARALEIVLNLLTPPLRPSGGALRALQERKTRLERKLTRG